MANPTLADLIGQKLAEAIVQAIKDAQGELTNVAVAGGDAASGGLLGDVGKLTGIISDVLGSVPIVGTLIQDLTDPLAPIEQAAGKLGISYGLGFLLYHLAFQMFDPVWREAIHASESAFTSQIFDPGTAAELVAKGIIDQNFGASEAGGGGLDASHFAQMVDAARVRPGLSELLQMLNRGEIQSSDVQLALERNGIPQFWWGPLIALRRYLLSPADLALASLRGIIDDNTMGQYASLLGVDPADMEVLIGNTGEPPGLMQLLEAYRRGFIDQATLTRGIRQSRVRDEWIDTVERLRYSPMSIADAVESTVQGHIDQDAMRKIADENGLEPGAVDTLYQTAGEPLSREEMARMYHRGLASKDELIQAVRESRIKNKYLQWIAPLSEQRIPYRTLNTIVEHGVRSKEWAIQYLMSDGYTRDDADALVSTSASAKVGQAKKLTEGQILTAYRTNSMKRSDAVDMLASVGYDAHESAVLLDSIDAERALSEQTKAITALRSQYLADRISIQTASGQLDQLGVLAGYRDQLLKDWQIERKGDVKTLTHAQVADAVYYQFWTFDEGVAKLTQLGYSANDAKIVIGIRLKQLPAGVTVSPPSAVGS